VLSEIKNRGVGDVCMVVCDGLKGLPTSIETVWPQAITQTCVVHLLRNSFRYASKKHWAALAKDLKPIYTAPSESAALDAFVALTEAWGDRYPAIIKHHPRRTRSAKARSRSGCGPTGRAVSRRADPDGELIRPCEFSRRPAPHRCRIASAPTRESPLRGSARPDRLAR
jgi:hypothetical protein